MMRSFMIYRVTKNCTTNQHKANLHHNTKKQNIVRMQASEAWCSFNDFPTERKCSFCPPLSFHAGTAGDRLVGPYCLPPHLTGALYHDFLRNFLPELLLHVDLQTRIHLRFMQDGSPPHFLPAVLLEQRISGTMDRARWANSLACSFP